MGATKIPEYHDLCFKVFCRFGGKNKEAMLRELKKQGCEITRPTLDAWIKELNMEERLKQADKEKREAADSQLTIEEKTVKALQKRKEHYETYLDSTPGVDTQVEYAYTGIIKMIFDIKSKSATYKVETFLTFLKDLIEYLSKNDPKAVDVIEDNFNEFVAWARAKYGAVR